VTDITQGVRELTFDEVNMVSGGGWFGDLMEAVFHFATQMLTEVIDAGVWLIEHGLYYKQSGDGWEVGFG
tara:strand:+ start:315 stop:524 length:210 start_codon:yes stop_codon:yes gene_type:complete